MRQNVTGWLVWLLMGWAIVSAAAAAREAMNREPDPVAALDAEFQMLSLDLPARAVVGFLEPETNRGNVEALRLRHVAQYALAPRIVVSRPGPEFLIVSSVAQSVGRDGRLAGFYLVAKSVSGHRIYWRLRP